MTIKAFAVDIDGTLTDANGVFNLDAAHTLRWLSQLGYKIIFVSGRSVWEILAFISFLGTTKIAVGENGGAIATTPINIKLLADKRDSLVAYDVLTKKIEGVKLRIVFPRLTEVVLERTFDAEKGRIILREAGIPIVLNDSKFAYHLTSKHVDKSKGLSTALEYLEIGPSEVIAIGDSDTDIPMFKLCGYSIALGNASENVKKEAKASIEVGFGQGFIEAVRHVTTIFSKQDED